MSRIRKVVNLPTKIEHLTTDILQDSDNDAWEDLIKPKPLQWAFMSGLMKNKVKLIVFVQLDRLYLNY